MYCIYWCEGSLPRMKMTDDLIHAIKICKDRRDSGHSFVTMAIENPDMVGKMGVDVTGPDYDWMKRRDSISGRKKAG